MLIAGMIMSVVGGNVVLDTSLSVREVKMWIGSTLLVAGIATVILAAIY
jgi:uncharacterized membrane protein HdeD (DUF308 family)